MKGDTAITMNSSAVQGNMLDLSRRADGSCGTPGCPRSRDTRQSPRTPAPRCSSFWRPPAKQRAGWELIKHMTSDHAYTEIASKIGYLPLRTSLTEDPATLKPWADSIPCSRRTSRRLDRLEPWVSYPGDGYVQIDDILATAVESVFYGKDPAATMAAAQQRAQDLLR